jgi:hypothetical protein
MRVGSETAEDFLVVDCLLPGKIRRLGRRKTFLSPRRPIRTTALECQIRGGEYTDYDRASYATAVRVWRDQAKAGDPEAQYYMGEIHEKGLGVEPDFGAAANWYLKAAEQGYKPAQMNLGYLYETGLGVDRDPDRALNWYREAAGLPEDLIVLEGSEYEELLLLEDELDAKNTEIERLESRLRELERDHDAGGAERRELESEVEKLRSELESKRLAAQSFKKKIASLEGDLSSRGREVQVEAPSRQSSARADLDFGPYHALIIGNRDYEYLGPFEGALKLANEAGDVLSKKYGFTVQKLLNANRYQILSALNQLREELTEQDNLLVYYVGHSVRETEQQRSYWQPIDAEPDSRKNWLLSKVISDHLNLIPAKHILVVAEASFAGVLSRSALPTLPRGMSGEQRHNLIWQMLRKRSRLLMAAGSQPGAEDRSTVFTATLLEVLRQNQQVLEASALYRSVRTRLVSEGEDAAGTPVYAPIRWTRSDGGGEFFFVPRESGTGA